jgi:hypothetical protein
VKEQLGQPDPVNDEQQVSLAIWERLPTDWLDEDTFLERLAEVSGLTEPWQNHDVTAIFVSMHSAQWLEVRRTGRLEREVRRSVDRPRFYSWQEQAETDAAEMLIFQREQRDKELQRAEEARQELQRPQREAEADDLREALNTHPVVVGLREEVHDLESEVRFLRSRLALLEARGGQGAGRIGGRR